MSDEAQEIKVVGRDIKEVPNRVMALAQALSARHGSVFVNREKKGWHVHMACPSCLENDGVKELSSRHLAVNADRYLQIGPYTKITKGKSEMSGACMKEDYRPYSVKNLLRMPPIERRLPEGTRARAMVVVAGKYDKLVELDASGNRIPLLPGKLETLDSLPVHHPAVRYVTQRGFEPRELTKQFGACFCSKEAPADRALNRYYPPKANGFKITPQGRIVFLGKMFGVLRVWQDRLLDIEEDGMLTVWHPYEERWVPVATVARDPETGKKIRTPIGGYEDVLDIPKYKISPGVFRNDVVMGLDSALVHSIVEGRSYAVCCEGVMDAASVGPGGIAIFGKSLGQVQAQILTAHFKTLIWVPDNDSHKKASVLRFAEGVGHAAEVLIAEVPPEYEDIGACPRDVAASVVKKCLERSRFS